MDVCHYCDEPITRHESWTIVSGDPSRMYHDACHRLDIYAHRDQGERLPEDEVWSPDDICGYESVTHVDGREHPSICVRPGQGCQPGGHLMVPRGVIKPGGVR